jgi:hypothetical protein
MKIEEVRARIEYGATYRIPSLEPRYLKAACDPNTAVVRTELERWARPYLVDYFGTPKMADQYLGIRLDTWSCWCYPTTLEERNVALACMTLCEALVDDAFARPEIWSDSGAAATLARRFYDLLDGRPVPPDFHAGRFLSAGIELMREVVTEPGLVQRYLDHEKEIITNLHDAARARRDGTEGDFPDLASYLTFRRVDLWGIWCVHNCERALGIDLGAERAAQPSLVRAGELMIDHLTLVNDLFSFSKEYTDGETTNYIWILMVRDGATLQESIDTVCSLMFETEREFVELCAEIARGPLSGHPDVPRYLDSPAMRSTGVNSRSRSSLACTSPATGTLT